MLPVITIAIAVITWIIKIIFIVYAFTIPSKIKRHLWYQHKQLEILVAMAQKAGVAEDELNTIMEQEPE